jgi:hypothetical protein
MFIGTNHYYSSRIEVGPDLGSDHVPVVLSFFHRVPPRLQFRSRWKFKDDSWADWSAGLEKLSFPRGDTASESYDNIHKVLIEHSRTIFHTSDSATPRRPGNPWWNGECEAAVKNRNKLRKIFYRFPTPKNRTAYNSVSAKAAEIIRSSKEKSWQQFVTSISHRTPTTQVWKMFRAVSGRQPPAVFPLSDGNQPLSNIDTAEAIALYLSSVFSVKHSILREEADFLISQLTVGDSLPFNQRFSLYELNCAISSLPARSSPGADLIHNNFLINLPEGHHRALLGLFNLSFRTGDIPQEWKSSTTIPIPKPGKDPTIPSSYRPISLLSCMAKLMERMILKRLTWVIEANSSLLPSQFGFRPQLSTMDLLALLEHDIQLAFRSKKIVLVVFFDLAGAFDRASHEGILYKLAKSGITGRILRWIQSFLRDRRFSVSLAGSVSQVYPINSGVPQGAILSPLLFNVLMRDMPQAEGVTTSLYADDITMYVTADGVGEAINLLQPAVDTLVAWVNRWGLVLNPQKSACTFFTRKNSETMPEHQYRGLTDTI